MRVFIVVETGAGWDNPDVDPVIATTSQALAEAAVENLKRDLGNGWEALHNIVTLRVARDWGEVDTFCEEYIEEFRT